MTAHNPWGGAAAPDNAAYLVAANSLQCADEYTGRLRAHMSASFAQQFASQAEMAANVLGELAALGASCREHAHSAMRWLAAEVLPLTWLRVDFESASFELP